MTSKQTRLQSTKQAKSSLESKKKISLKKCKTIRDFVDYLNQSTKAHKAVLKKYIQEHLLSDPKDFEERTDDLIAMRTFFYNCIDKPKSLYQVLDPENSILNDFILKMALFFEQEEEDIVYLTTEEKQAVMTMLKAE